MNDESEKAKVEKYPTKKDRVTEEVQTVRYTIKEFLELTREIFDADVCYLYLVLPKIDDYEREKFVRKRIKQIEEAYKDWNYRYPEDKDTQFPNELHKAICDPKRIKIMSFIDIAEKKEIWKFNHKNSPGKYMVFSGFNEGDIGDLEVNERSEDKLYFYTERNKKVESKTKEYKSKEYNTAILEEGLNAYVGRTKKTVIFSSDKAILRHRSSANLNVKKEITPRCVMMVGFPLIDEEHKDKPFIGILKVEKYIDKKYDAEEHNSNFDENDIDEKVDQVKRYLPLFVRLLKSSEKYFHSNSYEELFRGMDLLEDLKRIEPIIMKDLLTQLLKSLQDFYLSPIGSCEKLSTAMGLFENSDEFISKLNDMGIIEPGLSEELQSIKCCSLDNSEEVDDDLLLNDKLTKISEELIKLYEKKIDNAAELVTSLNQSIRHKEFICIEELQNEVSDINKNLEKIKNYMIISKEINKKYNNLQDPTKKNLDRSKDKCSEEIECPVNINKEIRKLLEKLDKDEKENFIKILCTNNPDLFNPKKIKCTKEVAKEVCRLLEHLKRIGRYEKTSKEIRSLLKNDDPKKLTKISNLIKDLNDKELEYLGIIINNLEDVKKITCHSDEIREDIDNLLHKLKIVENYEGPKEEIHSLLFIIKKIAQISIENQNDFKLNEQGYKEILRLTKELNDRLDYLKKIGFNNDDFELLIKDLNFKVDTLVVNELYLTKPQERINYLNEICEDVDSLLNVLTKGDELNSLFEDIKRIKEKSPKDLEKLKSEEEFSKEISYLCEEIIELSETLDRIRYHQKISRDIINLLNSPRWKKCFDEYNKEIVKILRNMTNKGICKLLIYLDKIKTSLPANTKNIHNNVELDRDICNDISSGKHKGLRCSEQINKEIFDFSLQLFLELKRKDCIGYDEILNRISEYANDISDLLDLNEDMTRSFREFLEGLRKHEELLLCGLNDYRDHFMHQFHVFISGYIIINKLGIGIFKDKIKDSLEFILDQENYKLNNSEVLRIWFLASFYHDYAYILEKLEKELETFFKDVLGYPFKVTFNWEQLLKRDSEFPKYLNLFIKFFKSTKGTKRDTLLRNYLDSIITNHDHGVLSALLLTDYNSKKSTQKRFNECLYAALAISLHNKPIYENLTEGNKDSVLFESFPIAFLLAYCDTAQAFGRLEGKEHHESSKYPVKFSGIEIKKENEKTKIAYKLTYICEQLDKIPTTGMLKKWANNVDVAFKSEKFDFEIEYYKKGDKTPFYALSFH